MADLRKPTKDTMEQADVDIKHMRTCLSLAHRAAGRTSPNPMVGAAVVDESGEVVSVGYHRAAGKDHGEIVALKKAGDRAAGSTLYVNLEPCRHQGRTGPCVEVIKKSGIKRVVAGMVDPNPAVAGGGIEELKQAGIEVTVGVLEEECRWLNRGFIKHMTQGLPWVCLKLATTLDGRIADREGASRWITGRDARRYVHQLRDTYDCVMVGGYTAVKDDPELNVRELEDGRDPIRVVVDCDLKLNPESRVCRAGSGGDTIIFCSEPAAKSRASKFPENVRIAPVPADSKNADLLDLKEVLMSLARHPVLSVLCEGGGRLAAGLLDAGLVDEVHWIVSPKIIMDAEAIPAVAGKKPVSLADVTELKRVVVRRLGDDICIQGLLSEDLIGSA